MIEPPQAGEDVGLLWRKVAECVAFCNALERMTVKVTLEKFRLIVTADGNPAGTAIGYGAADKLPTTGRIQMDSGSATLLLE